MIGTRHVLALAALVPTVAAGLPGCHRDSPALQTGAPLVRAGGGGMAITTGAWRGELGIFPRYADGDVLPVSFAVRNAWPSAVTIVAVDDGAAAHRLLDLVGARVTRTAPRDPMSPVPPASTMAPPYGRLTLQPQTIPPGGWADLQLNYAFVGCEWFRTGDTRVYGRTVVIRYRRADGIEDTQPLAAIPINVTAPRRCPRRPAAPAPR